MAIKTTKNIDDLIIHLSGPFTYQSRFEFRDAYKNEKADLHYFLDFSQVDYIDSSAMGMMMLLREHAGGDRGSVTLKSCNADIKKLLQMAQLDQLFKII